MTTDAKNGAVKMFRHACAFADCATFCEREPESIVVRTQWYTTPGIVNAAFACEVFLKSLLLYQGLSPKEIRRCRHCLKDLWRELQLKNQEICDSVETQIVEYFKPKNKHFFEESLGDISDAFETWRYIYEAQKARVNLNFMRIFRETLRNTCCITYYNMTWNEFVSRNCRWDVEKV